MNKQRGTPGYCSSCMKNTPHLRLFHSRILWFIDLLTLRIARLFRLGPWYCMQCERQRTVLRPVRKSAREYRPEDHDCDSTSDASASGELVGNFIRTDQSLVVRRSRASRFSQKYRDGIVQRILSGATFSQLGVELNVSENDLIDWIADMLARKQEKIDELKSVVDAFHGARSDQSRISYEPVSVIIDDDAATIEGSVRSRS